MPFLDAKALETDPEGMAFLRSVIGPHARRRKAAPKAPPAEDRQEVNAASPGQGQAQPNSGGTTARERLETA